MKVTRVDITEDFGDDIRTYSITLEFTVDKVDLLRRRIATDSNGETLVKSHLKLPLGSEWELSDAEYTQFAKDIVDGINKIA